MVWKFPSLGTSSSSRDHRWKSSRIQRLVDFRSFPRQWLLRDFVPMESWLAYQMVSIIMNRNSNYSLDDRLMCELYQLKVWASYNCATWTIRVVLGLDGISYFLEVSLGQWHWQKRWIWRGSSWILFQFIWGEPFISN